MQSFTTACVIAQHQCFDSRALRETLRETLTRLIEQGVTKFLFRGHNLFSELCYQYVTELQAQYPQIERVYYRTEFDNRRLIKQHEQIVDCAYIVCNYAMIDQSDICIFYYNQISAPPNSRSIAYAYDYARDQAKRIFNVFV